MSHSEVFSQLSEEYLDLLTKQTEDFAILVPFKDPSLRPSRLDSLKGSFSTSNALIQFVYTLCSQPEIHTDKMRKIFSFCPMPITDKRFDSSSGTLLKQAQNFVNPRNREAIEALGYFLLRSKGVYYKDGLDLLYEYLDTLLFCINPEYHTESSPRSYHHAAELTASILTVLKQIRASYLNNPDLHGSDRAHEITERLLHFFRDILNSNNEILTYGMFIPLGHSIIPLDRSQFTTLSEQLLKKFKTSPRFQILCLKVMKQLLKQSHEVCPVQDAETFLSTAQTTLGDSSHLPKNIIASTLDVMITAAIHFPQLVEEVRQYLEVFLQQYFTAPGFRYQKEAFLEYRTALAGMVEIAKRYPKKTSAITDFIVENLLKSAETPTEGTQYALLRDGATAQLCELLQQQINLENGDVRMVRAVFTTLYTPFYLAHVKYISNRGQRQNISDMIVSNGTGTMAKNTVPGSPNTVMQSHQRNEDKLLNIISVLGHITRAVKDERVTDFIASRFISEIHYPLMAVDQLLIQELYSFCLLGQTTSFNAITLELMTIFRRIERREAGSHLVPNHTIADVLIALAHNVKQPELRRNLSERVMRLFLQLGKEVSPQELRLLNNSTSPLIQGMGYLLPVLAELSQDMTEFDTLSPDLEGQLVPLYRNVWFYCVLLKFVEYGTWKSDWFAACQRLASKLPVLVTRTALDRKQTELDLQALFHNAYTQKEMPSQGSMLQRSLIDLLPSQGGPIRNLTVTQELYILSIYHLETLRSSAGLFRPLFAYLEDPQILVNDNLARCVKGIAEKCFPIFVSAVQKLPDDKRRERLIAEASNLLTKFCNRSPIAHEVAKNCLGSEKSSRKVGSEGLLAIFPQISWEERCVKVLLDLVELTGKACTAPTQIIHNTNNGVEADRSRAVKIDRTPENEECLPLLNQKDRQTLLRELVELTTTYLNTGLRTAPIQTKAVLQAYMSDLRKSSSLGYLNHVGYSLAVDIVSQETQIDVKKSDPLQCLSSQNSTFINSLALKTQYGGEVDGIIAYQGEGGEVVQVARVLAQRLRDHVTQKGDHFDLRGFNSTMFRAVAFIIMQPRFALDLVHLVCWSPVLVFQRDTMTIAVGAWNWLLSDRPELRTQVMAEICDAWYWTIENRVGLFSDVKRPPSPVSVNRVHLSQDHLAVGKNDPSPHRIWIEFLHERFVVTRHTSPDEFSLILRMCHHALAKPESFNVLPLSVAIRFRLLLLCLELIHSGSVRDIALEHVLRERVYRCALHWFTYEPSWYNQTDRQILTADVHAIVDFCKLIQKEGTVKEKELSHEAPYSHPDMWRVRKLIVILCANEIERIVAWTNPLGEPMKKIEGEDSFTNIKSISWTETVRLAWELSPALAVQLHARFPGTKNLRAMLENRVQKDPGAVVDIVEALPFLVNESTVRNNIPQLKYLLYWTPATPPMAITLLQKEFSTCPLVVQYAVRVLFNFNPDTIIYYIPQLVQTLRYDNTGLIFQYLVDVSKQSELLAHQLIWNIQTYTTNKEVNRLTDVGNRLEKAILAAMTPDILARYRIEFDFFETVTGISAILLNGEAKEHKELRKPILVKELRQLVLPSTELYLPTNPSTKVHGIIPERGVALQSAQKAPIMVAFQCHHREDERRNERGELGYTKTFVQSCIFKTGDDVRQDMLAIQIIDLFQRIFQTIGLDLFLYPYKVIATEPESGLLEVVPNSMSRDALGKKLESGGLNDYFQRKYGPLNSEGYQQAQLNFIKSMAAYAVVCFLLNIKDRHNGNILVDEAGHIIHIDFGFIFDTSPGGDIGFEVAPFKLSDEMIDLMGGLAAEPFKVFMDLSIKAFLAVRQHSDTIITLVTLMLETNLPSLKPAQTIAHLRDLRLVPDKSERAAAKHFFERIEYAHGTVASRATILYDAFQHATQGIDY
ncbi:phosphatidylinositol 4 kinase, putative-like [Planoprotostelium fungivorum]|uniref:1-phosphatidylinositol 4-kinase n=1 Tax=Planoprotostelium fungivorum TaxID=1890364 RepID=A0A2P6NS28_9EUKA|nr:phosphatidylinositol 4 kinase, putative-like [Planoprotostelium fungivorum]